MKKLLIKLSLIVLCLSFIAPTALAAQYHSCADSLLEMGLFKGSDTGYELDRMPQRSEAAVMLVRLLGAESIALDENYQHPYSDVPDWASPYVGYLYKNNIVKGISETQFGSNIICDAKMYTTLVLRAMDYSDSEENGDFTYDAVLDFASEVGIINPYIKTTPFLRDEMVAISFLALYCKPKDYSQRFFLDKLVSEGAVKQSIAQAYLDAFSDFEALSVATDAAAAVDKCKYTYSSLNYAESNSGNVLVENTISVSYIKKSDSFIMSGYANADGFEYKIYYTGGYLYTDINGQKVKTTMLMDEAIGEFALSFVAGDILYGLTNITKRMEGTETVLEIPFSPKELPEMLTSILGEDYLVEFKNFTIDTASAIVVIDEFGNLIEQNVYLVFGFDFLYEGTYYPSVYITLLTLTILETGDDVIVELPSDLSGYKMQE